MALNPIEITGTVNRATDMYNMRNQHENRMFADNSVPLHTVDKKADDQNKKVVKSDNADLMNKKFDAKEKGSNQYFNNRNNKNKDKETDGTVRVKNSGGFDISI